MLQEKINALIDQYFRTRELTQKILSLSKKRKKRRIKPVITLSRETGSGGRPIARLVAKTLKFDYYDKKLVEMIARKTKKRKEIVESVDEKVQDYVSGFVESLLGIDSLSRSSYFGHLCEVIISIAKKGKAVILGRGANFIIPTNECLSVRIIAPLKTRIENSIKYEGNTPLQARREIKRIHFERKDFIRRYFHKNISNANYYDLVINTKNFDIQQASKIVIDTYKSKFPKGFIWA